MEDLKVKMANAVYVNVGLIMKRAWELNIWRVVENPRSSYLWMLEPYQQMLSQGCYDVDFQACAFGGKRPKWTRFRTDVPGAYGLRVPCPGERPRMSTVRGD